MPQETRRTALSVLLALSATLRRWSSARFVSRENLQRVLATANARRVLLVSSATSLPARRVVNACQELTLGDQEAAAAIFASLENSLSTVAPLQNRVARDVGPAPPHWYEVQTARISACVTRSFSRLHVTRQLAFLRAEAVHLAEIAPLVAYRRAPCLFSLTNIVRAVIPPRYMRAHCTQHVAAGLTSRQAAVRATPGIFAKCATMKKASHANLD